MKIRWQRKTNYQWIESSTYSNNTLCYFVCCYCLRLCSSSMWRLMRAYVFAVLDFVAFNCRRRISGCLGEQTEKKPKRIYSGWFRVCLVFEMMWNSTYNSITCSPYERYCFNENQFVGMSYLNWWSVLSAFAFMLQKYVHLTNDNKLTHAHSLTHSLSF